MNTWIYELSVKYLTWRNIRLLPSNTPGVYGHHGVVWQSIDQTMDYEVKMLQFKGFEKLKQLQHNTYSEPVPNADSIFNIGWRKLQIPLMHVCKRWCLLKMSLSYQSLNILFDLTEQCSDEGSYCSLVHRLQMCNNPSYQRRCCKTCQSYGWCLPLNNPNSIVTDHIW